MNLSVGLEERLTESLEEVVYYYLVLLLYLLTHVLLLFLKSDLLVSIMCWPLFDGSRGTEDSRTSDVVPTCSCSPEFLD